MGLGVGSRLGAGLGVDLDITSVAGVDVGLLEDSTAVAGSMVGSGVDFVASVLASSIDFGVEVATGVEVAFEEISLFVFCEDVEELSTFDTLDTYSAIGLLLHPDNVSTAISVKPAKTTVLFMKLYLSWAISKFFKKLNRLNESYYHQLLKIKFFITQNWISIGISLIHLFAQ